jgi:hypothetical protein
VTYQIGDELLINVRDDDHDESYIVSAKVQVIGLSKYIEETLCYVPQYYSLRHSFLINYAHQRHYKFDPKFIDEYGMFLSTRVAIVKHIHTRDGQSCINCGEFYDFAEENTEIGFLCHLCVTNPYR